MDNVVEFNGVTTLDLTPDRVIKEALKAKMTEVVIVGFDEDGEFYFASSQADGGNVIYHLEMAKYHLLKIGNQEDD